ncbi:Ubiquitin carboxyl-terminal hydrolase [Penicillium ucsense]|uniref:Ubiquitin carboxyl-terminal hydrolase n=1 Tax=Penicillium ucsense TaxID=2839758 RepID=A0A8J8W6C6_9EURO|nr:Ubiquitin carboxyl-terminal hydrolase [Penicillium ucsense]KAF7729086.1 Ubiquitin carboxyl-terminal hydrolase [Penicillium ucsense]
MADTGGWSTIESDEGLFTSLIENLGVKNVQFEELISLDADTIRSLGSVYGVIFLFKWTREAAGARAEAPLDGTYDQTASDNDVFFAAQTIQNACGTQAILSVILNHDNPSAPLPPIALGPELRSFKDFTAGFPAELRGEALSNSEAIRTAHNSFARASPFADETARPQDEENAADVYHFIAYTPVNGTLYELDGLQPYPISHGACDPSSFPEKVIEVLQRRIARYPPEETHFNLMAVVQDPRPRAREIGDVETLEREERKRAAWAWENTLRRWNFVGFIGEMMKGVAGMKEAQDGSGKAFDEWVDNAKQATRKRLEMRR